MILSPSTARSLREMVRRDRTAMRAEKHPRPDWQNLGPTPVRWVRVRNDAAEPIPAWGIVRTTGVATVNGEQIITVAKPLSGFAPAMYLINSHFYIPVNGLGFATREGPAEALVQTVQPVTTATLGTVLGPVSNFWDLWPQGTSSQLDTPWVGLTAREGASGNFSIPPGPQARMLVTLRVPQGSAAAGVAPNSTQTFNTTLTTLELTQAFASGGSSVLAATDVLVIGRAGTYLVLGQVHAFGDTLGSIGKLFLYKNGAAINDAEYGEACQVTSSRQAWGFQQLVTLAANDQLSLRAQATSGTWTVNTSKLTAVLLP